MKTLPDITKNLIEAIENNELKLPTQPEVAVRIRECAEDPNVTPLKLAKVISHDPVLTARFIQMANSPTSRGVVAIESLPNVISRLGVPFVSNLATGLAMEQIFQATNETIDQLMYEAWSSSTYVAAYAHVLAKRFSTIPSEIASLAGLMHQIGVLPILVYAQDNDMLIEDKQLLLALIKEYHPKIGRAILHSWEFPREISSLPTQLYLPTPEDANKPQLIDVVQVALFKTQALKKNFIEMEMLYPALHKQLNLDDESPLENDAFKNDLQESVRFYCQLS